MPLRFKVSWTKGKNTVELDSICVKAKIAMDGGVKEKKGGINREKNRMREWREEQGFSFVPPQLQSRSCRFSYWPIFPFSGRQQKKEVSYYHPPFSSFPPHPLYSSRYHKNSEIPSKSNQENDHSEIRTFSWSFLSFLFRLGIFHFDKEGQMVDGRLHNVID